MGIASFVIGAFSTAFSIIPFGGIIALIPSIIGIVLGIMDLIQKRNTNENRVFSIIGIILCSIAIINIILWGLFTVGAIVSAVF